MTLTLKIACVLLAVICLVFGLIAYAAVRLGSGDE